MSELEMKKQNIVIQLRGLCAHCGSGRDHACPLQQIAAEVAKIHGVPLIVNNEFKGMLWA